MTHLDTPTSSLAQKLARGGFRGTPIATAIAELVGSYLGAGNVDGKLLSRLQGTNSAVGGIIDQPLGEVKTHSLPSGESTQIALPETERKAA